MVIKGKDKRQKDKQGIAEIMKEIRTFQQRILMKRIF